MNTNTILTGQDPDELVEIGQYEGDDMSRYTLSWKDFVNVGMVLPGTKLYARRSDIATYQHAICNPYPSTVEPGVREVPAETESTIMDKDRFDCGT